MEFKFIIYLIGGILYFLYKRREAAQNNPPDALPRPAKAPRPTGPSKTIDEILAEARKALQQNLPEEKPVTYSAPPQPPKVRPMQAMMKPEEEGVTDFVPDMLQVSAYTPIAEFQQQEGLSGVKSILEIMKEEDEGIETMQIDLRQALIYQTILERKFTV